MRWICTLLIIALFTFLIGCSDKTPQEPEGTPVTLTSDELDANKWAKESMRMWSIWHLKGVSLTKEGRYEEALYCYNQAIEEWPEELEEDEDSRIRHLPEATDTYLKKAELYLKMNKPELALIYFEKFESFLPGNKYAREGKQKAKEMLEP